MAASDQIHFRDLDEDQKLEVISSLSKLKLGLVAIVSNKRNMRRYRNLRCEAKNLEFARGRNRPRKYNWFYNGLFRYLLERASAECKRWTHRAYGEVRSIKIILSNRKDISNAQTGAYLLKLKTERRDQSYFNNKRQIDWSVIDVFDMGSRRPREVVGLQIADCAASAIFRALDETWFGNAKPGYLELLREKFVRNASTPRDYGFKLLPDNFNAPLSDDQRRALLFDGYRI
jgi:hypothetical protein